MKRILIFARRVMLELLRDPMSWVFSIGFPVVMLVVMTLLNRSIPKEADMDLFTLPSLVPAVWVFGMSFLMLFTAQLIARDRSEAFLIRLYLSPMKTPEFLLGYLIPVSVLGILQGLLTFLCGFIISIFTGETMGSAAGILLTVLFSLPSLILFIAIGLLFGALFSERAAPGISSAVISAAGLLGGLWMDVDKMGGTWLDICCALPFYHAVKLARGAFSLQTGELGTSLLPVSLYATAIFILASFLFLRQKKQ